MELKNLFLVSEENGKTFVTNQGIIDYYRDWRRHMNLKVVEELGPIWTKNAEVEPAEGGGGNCYVWQNYKITADEPLNERDMEIIRAQYPFISGQRTAEVNLNSFQEVDGKFVYKAYSERDSGD
jgi:hypothetical protein